jgi:glycerophosphoryl diester phosphodiesterase
MLSILAPTPGLAQDNPWMLRRVLNMAHRGGRVEAPEHTLYAYKVALPKGVNTLEIDVQRTADGVLVCHHDSTVDRVTNGTGRIDEMTLAELKALDNAYWFDSGSSYPFRGVATGGQPPPPGFTAEDFQIATMREVLEIFPNVLMSIEIKGEAPASVPAAEQLADLLGEFGRVGDAMVASFDDATIAAFKARDPTLHTTPGLAEMVDWALVSGPYPLPHHVALQVPRIYDPLELLVPTPELVATAHSFDLAVYVFISLSEETTEIYNELIDAGVDGIITDRPTDLQVVLEARGLVYGQLESKDQQSCINELNKGLAKVAKTQGKDIGKCIKDGSKGKLEGQSIEECITADNKGKVAKAKQKTISKASPLCGVPPDFGPSDPNTVNQVAVEKELSLIHEVFGSDLDAATAIISAADNKDGSKCQQGVAKAMKKCQDAKLKVFNACKKSGLSAKSSSRIVNPLGLAGCFSGRGDSIAADVKGKVAKACDPGTGKIKTTIDKKCVADLGAFAGCNDPNGPLPSAGELATCIDRLVECEVCLALNAADDLYHYHDCDLFDDGEANGSCP